MLVDLPAGAINEQLIALMDPVQRLDTGLYVADINFEHALDAVLVEAYPYDIYDAATMSISVTLSPLSPGLPTESYGVCDYPQQVIEKYPGLLTDTRECIIRFCEFRRDDETGWRWHKWGPYIGEQNPQYEYLRDEPEIEAVWAYHIHEIKDGIKPWEAR